MNRLTIAVLAAVAATCAACKEITFAQVDGVNDVTIEIDESGFISSTRTTTAHVPQKAEAVPVIDESFAYRTARDQTEQEYVVLRMSDWQRLTNTVERLRVVSEKRWNIEHATAEGRKAWHGSPVRNMAYDGSEIVWEYPDGYRYVQKVAPALRVSPRVQSVKNGPTSAPNPNRYKHFPPRLRAKRLAQDAQGKATEVNATFGPGGKVLKVEESK